MKPQGNLKLVRSSMQSVIIWKTERVQQNDKRIKNKRQEDIQTIFSNIMIHYSLSFHAEYPHVSVAAGFTMTCKMNIFFLIVMKY